MFASLLVLFFHYSYVNVHAPQSRGGLARIICPMLPPSRGMGAGWGILYIIAVCFHSLTACYHCTTAKRSLWTYDKGYFYHSSTSANIAKSSQSILWVIPTKIFPAVIVSNKDSPFIQMCANNETCKSLVCVLAEKHSINFLIFCFHGA